MHPLLIDAGGLLKIYAEFIAICMFLLFVMAMNTFFKNKNHLEIPDKPELKIIEMGDFCFIPMVLLKGDIIYQGQHFSNYDLAYRDAEKARKEITSLMQENAINDIVHIVDADIETNNNAGGKNI